MFIDKVCVLHRQSKWCYFANEVHIPDEEKAREVERKYRITSKQYVEGGLQLRVISEIQPELECMSVPATLEDAYIYFTNRYNK